MKNNKVKVSIIVPAYNVSNYIGQCISSIQNQSYNNIEIIVINDGSTDSTLNIINNIAEQDSRVIVINRPNKGVSSVRNVGVEYSSGEWIVFVDGDDYLANNFIEHMLEIAEITNADFCLSTDCYKSTNDVQNKIISIDTLNSVQATTLLLSTKVDVGCWNKMFKKRLLDENNIRFNEKLFYGEGLSFITTCAQYSKIIGVSNMKLYYYRQNNLISATKKFNIEKIQNGWMALNNIEDNLILKDKSIDNMLKCHRCLFALAAVTKILNSKNRKEYSEEYNYYLSYVRKNSFKEIVNGNINKFIKLKLALCCFSPKLLSYCSLISMKRRTMQSV